MQQQSRHRNHADSQLKNEYANFLSDFQPWARLLSEFVNSYGSDVLQEHFNITQLPRIEKPKVYGNFVVPEYIGFFEKNKNSKHFGKRLIQFIQDESVVRREEGYPVSEDSWEKFIRFMSSETDLNQLKNEELRELCQFARFLRKHGRQNGYRITTVEKFWKPHEVSPTRDRSFGFDDRLLCQSTNYLRAAFIDHFPGAQ